MQLSLADAEILLLAFIIPLVLLLFLTPRFTEYLAKRGHVLDDVHKRPPTKVAAPVGPLLFAAVFAGEVLVFFSFGTPVPLVVTGSAAIAFAIGLVDDLFVLGGKAKPLLLVLAAAPLLLVEFFQQ